LTNLTDQTNEDLRCNLLYMAAYIMALSRFVPLVRPLTKPMAGVHPDPNKTHEPKFHLACHVSTRHTHVSHAFWLSSLNSTDLDTLNMTTLTCSTWWEQPVRLAI